MPRTEPALETAKTHVKQQFSQRHIRGQNVRWHPGAETKARKISRFSRTGPHSSGAWGAFGYWHILPVVDTALYEVVVVSGVLPLFGFLVVVGIDCTAFALVPAGLCVVPSFDFTGVVPCDRCHPRHWPGT